MLEFIESAELSANIKVIGVGGGGSNAVNTMIQAGLTGTDFIVANTDAQALRTNSASIKIQLGEKVTKGLGAGANPDVGKRSAIEDRDKIYETLNGADMIFITAGLGGGTGTGAAPIIAQVAKEIGALTVAVVTKPFAFEGKKRMMQAEEGLKELKSIVDTVITIPNQRLLAVAGKSTTMVEAFRKVDEVLHQAVKGISDLINVHGMINVDFADVKAIMSEMGMALMGTGVAEGDNKALEAAQKAIASPLLEDISIEGARGLLINVTGGPDLSLFEVNEAIEKISAEAHPDATIIYGQVIDESMDGKIMITVIATGFGKEHNTANVTNVTNIANIKKQVSNNSNINTMDINNFNEDKPKRSDSPADANFDFEIPEIQEIHMNSRNNDVVKNIAPKNEKNDYISKFSKKDEEDDDYEDEKFDIPTFLRKQAD
ncbi:MAG: cell division protein FtsZ [Candidatus Acididesulfobacter diazotrophicus]|jgi:cell division protein FtsZ|uniref:Cell division protein FtsZ n=1 Tax=Candidatus Acididesulfobacter diazotrophicus TaxID=2597226 RepID=A0A519BNI9_9DELT|nr:MAG: cell division protein FtsZ [Candidatus Acididesulfobacter diazotrophicus]